MVILVSNFLPSLQNIQLHAELLLGLFNFNPFTLRVPKKVMPFNTRTTQVPA